MKIALALHNGFGFESVKYVARTIHQALGDRHETHTFAIMHEYADRRRTEEIATQLVARCDLIVGFPVMLAPLLAARARMQKEIPAIIFALGAFPAGAVLIARLLRYLNTHDLVVVNATADLALARKFVKNIRLALLPLPYDDTVFHPWPAEERRNRRLALGCDEQSRILLSAGRATIEKNVHTTLRVFGAVSQTVPDAHLVIAGPVENTPFSEFGIYPLNYLRTLERIRDACQIPANRVHLIGPIERDGLAGMYNVADGFINMTLHHDENFGLVQVESTACGTPVVGTAWGGLRDTVREGANGLKVGTRATPLGVKINWWEAANKTIALLNAAATDSDESRERLAAESTRYRPAVFREGLEKLVHDATREGREIPSPLQSTAFGDQYWALCTTQNHPHARYSPNTRSFELYRELITEYTEVTDEMIEPGEPFVPQQVLVLLSPMTIESSQRCVVDDPLYPFVLELPERLRHSVMAILEALAHEPAMTIASLVRAVEMVDSRFEEAVRWMEMQGVVARSKHDATWVAPCEISRTMRAVPFRHQRVNVGACDALITTDGASLPRFTT